MLWAGLFWYGEEHKISSESLPPERHNARFFFPQIIAQMDSLSKIIQVENCMNIQNSSRRITSRFMRKVHIGWKSHFYISAYQMDISLKYFVRFLLWKIETSWRSWYIIKLCIIFFFSCHFTFEREQEMKRNESKHLDKWRKLSLDLCFFFTRWLRERKPLDYGCCFFFLRPIIIHSNKMVHRCGFLLLCFHCSFKQNGQFTASVSLKREKLLPFSFRKHFNAKCHVSHLIIIKSL